MGNIFNELKEDLRFQLKGLLLIALSLLCFAGLRFTEETGSVGFFLAGMLNLMAGELAYLIPLIICLLGIKNIFPGVIKNARTRFIGFLILMLLLLVTVHLNLMIEAPLEEYGIYEASYNLGIQRLGGGLIGALLSVILFFFFGEIGSYIVVGVSGLVAILLMVDVSLTQLLDVFKSSFSRGFPRVKTHFLKMYDLLFREDVEGEGEDNDSSALTASSPGGYSYDEGERAKESPLPLVFSGKEKNFPGKDQVKEDEVKNRDRGERAEGINNTGDNGREKAVSINLAFNNQEMRGYELPYLSLLPHRTQGKDKQQKKVAMERSKTLEGTLNNFGVKVKNIKVYCGPTVTRYELQPDQGVKVSRIVNLADDLALSLAAPGVRIEAPIPGKAAVGIEVPNKKISPVYLRNVLEDPGFMESESRLTIGLGRDLYGNALIADLSKMPHLLIAGATGSGKSVSINALIISILFKAHPEEVKFLMIDPKYVELSTYNGIPHLLTPVISDKKKASSALKKMVKEMNERYEKFAQEGVRDIVSYNELMRGENQLGQVLPCIVVIIDELADIMLISPQEVEDAIARLAQMARAAGIHLVLATQRPSVNVITGVIKANITTRIAFAVSSNTDSRVILDRGGAEKLIGQGDMLYHPVGIQKPLRVQGAFISEQEVKKIVNFIREQGVAQEDEEIFPDKEDEEAGELADVDEVFQEALKEVVNSGQASISFLQRRFHIGHVRAGRIIDEMEKMGIVSSFEGSKARKVLISPEQIPDYLNEN